MTSLYSPPRACYYHPQIGSFCAEGDAAMTLTHGVLAIGVTVGGLWALAKLLEAAQR